MKQKYQDKMGEIWERINRSYVRRLSDGNVGGWFYGDGLTPYYSPTLPLHKDI